MNYYFVGMKKEERRDNICLQVCLLKESITCSGMCRKFVDPLIFFYTFPFQNKFL